MTPAWAGTTIRFTPTGCSAREDPSVSRAAQPYKIVNSAVSPSLRYEATCRTAYLASWHGYDTCVANSSMDVSILAFLAAAFDAGAVLVEPDDLMRRSDRSAHDVNSALAAMCQHRPEVIRAVVVEDRVVAVTGLTVAGWHLATCLAVDLAGAPPNRRGCASVPRVSARRVWSCGRGVHPSVGRLPAF